jgi:glycosyltransferase involved in cell wall biosynthesis
MLVFVVACSLLWALIYFALMLGIRRKQPNYPEFNPSVSVIIAAKNEEKNLSSHLPHILSQQYPEFEVIVSVNQTTDNTIKVLEKLQQQYPHLQWIERNNIPENTSPKKYALAQAILKAKHEHLLFTDADCIPNSKKWIANMIQPFANPKTEIVLGYSPYKQENSFLNSFIQYETTFTAVQYLGLAKIGLPYMGVGRNLAYKKSLFEKHTFESHKHILSGDDDLFINQTANKNNTVVQTNHDAWVYSTPQQQWASWYRQKSRHISTGKHYKNIHLFILGIISLFNILLPFLPFLYFLIQEKFYIFALPLLLVYFCTAVLFKLYRVRIKTAHFILLPFAYSLYQVIFSIKGIFSNKHKTW